jgi:hypothetical protein
MLLPASRLQRQPHVFCGHHSLAVRVTSVEVIVAVELIGPVIVAVPVPRLNTQKVFGPG